MSKKISVLIADDALVILEGLKHILKDVGDIELVAFAQTPEQVLDISANMHPDVIVLDMKWYGEDLVGIRLIRELRLISPKSTIVAFTAYTNLLDEAKNEGAGYTLDKFASKQTLIETIRKAGLHHEQLTNDADVNVLFVAADPTDATRLRLGEEYREIQEKLQMAKLRKKIRTAPKDVPSSC